MPEKKKSPKVNVEVVQVGSNNYVLFRPSNVYTGLRDKTALHIGNLDKNKVFQPTKAYFELTKDYLEALVFPSYWSLKNIPEDNLPGCAKTKITVTTTATAKKESEKEELAPELKNIDSQINANFNKRLCFGGTWFLYQAALKLGIVEDLMEVFCGDREKVNRILALVSFALMSNDDYDDVDYWQKDNFLLTRAYLNYQRVVSIFSDVTEEECEKFMLLRRKRIPKENMAELCVQTNSYYKNGSASDESEEDGGSVGVEYHNVVFYAFPCEKERFLKDYNFSKKTPFYLAELPSKIYGKESNAADLLNVIDKVTPTNLDNFCLVTDCGHTSLSDIDPLIRRGIKFQSRAYPDQDDLKLIIKEEFPQKDQTSSQEPSLFDQSTDQSSYQTITRHRLKSDNPTDTCSNEEREVEIRTTLNFDPAAQEDWMDLLNDELEEQWEKANDAFNYQIPIVDPKRFEKECPLLKFVYNTETGTIKYLFHNEEKIQNETLIAGFEGFRTFGFDADSDDVLTLDGEFLVQEYVLSQFKGRLGQNRFVGNEKEAQQGKRLTVFVALILYQFLEQLKEENDLFRIGVEPNDILSELNKVYATLRNGKVFFAGKNISRYQQCLKAIGGALPTGVRVQEK